MKKIILVSFIAFSLIFIRNVNAYSIYCTNTPITDEKHLSYIERLVSTISTRIDFNYYMYCYAEKVDSNKQEPNTPFLCLLDEPYYFKNSFELSPTNSPKCTYALKVDPNLAVQNYVNSKFYVYSMNALVVRHNPYKKIVVSDNGSTGVTNSNYENLIKAILMILVTILFLIFVLKVMGV